MLNGFQPVISPSTGAKSKPILDEAGFQQLLAAAYVLQQHNDSLRSKDPRLDTAWIFSEIAETQSEVREKRLSLEKAAGVIAERLRKITSASGTSVSVMRKGVMDCVAESGTSASVPGGSVVSNSLVGSERLRNGREFHSSDAQRDTRLDVATCRASGIGSVLAVPIQGEKGGLIEVRWSKPDGFHECDVRTSELMAGFITELLEKKEVEEFHSEINSAEKEPASGLAAESEEAKGFNSTATGLDEVSDVPSPDPPAGSADPLANVCRVCGRSFRADEAFCGNCSMPRVAGASNQNLQSKWASMWFMQQAHDTRQDRSIQEPPLRLTLAKPRLEDDQRESLPASTIPENSSSYQRTEPQITFEHVPYRETESSSLSLWTPSEPATTQRDTVEQDEPYLQRFLVTLRTQASRSGRAAQLAFISGSLVLILIVWSFWSVPANSSQLTWFESMLVQLGLAEAPQRVPVLTGKPDVRVWVDVHTGLYYCPGSDLYGKTPGGHFSKQRAALGDQFEPATRAVCE
jgi:hypothetical protein